MRPRLTVAASVAASVTSSVGASVASAGATVSSVLPVVAAGDEAGHAPAVKLSSEDNYRLGLERYEKKSYRKAMEYLLKAAEEGMGKASIMIGELYEKGQGVEKSNQRALEWYFKAYQQGEPKGMEYYQALYFRSKARW
jgi:TPR repeat protein